LFFASVEAVTVGEVGEERDRYIKMGGGKVRNGG
jgi:hypothetical protein